MNPLEWVYRPVMCALRDALVPDKGLTLTRLTTVRTKLSGSGPGPAWTQVTDILGSVPSEGGCRGPEIAFTLGGEPFSFFLLDACTAPMSTAAGYAKTLSGVVISITGALSIARAVAMGFGFNFSMGRGGGGDD